MGLGIRPIQHTRLYSKICICWEEEDGSQQTIGYKYKTQEDLDLNIAKIKALKDIFPRLSIKKSLIDHLKTLRPAQYPLGGIEHPLNTTTARC